MAGQDGGRTQKEREGWADRADEPPEVDRTGYQASISGTAAIDLVRQHIRRRGYDTTGYPGSALRADRGSTVRVVESPAPEDDIALNRAVFYAAADGEVERSTSSVPWTEFARGVEARFRRRRDRRG